MEKRNLKFLKELKNSLQIPLRKAIELANQCGEDCEKCKKAFYEEKIKSIIQQTDCSFDEAKELLDIYKDTQKVIKKLSEKIIRITIANKPITEKYGFELWGEYENEKICYGNNAVIFIPFSHFELILDDFKSVFPIENYCSEDNFFDITGTNSFDRKSINQIVKRILNKKYENQDEADFIKQITNWLIEKSKTAKNIIVFGNL